MPPRLLAALRRRVRRWFVGPGIFGKLLVPKVLLTTALVVTLGVWHTHERDRDFTQAMTRRAHEYGTLFATQVRSAVAFGDAETAREVLASLVEAPDVTAVVLTDERGEALFRAGEPSPWTSRARAGVVAQRLVTSGGRIAVVAPVESLEGPWGTLVVELSTDQLEAAKREVRITVAIAGGAAALISVLVSWLLARYLTRRLKPIAAVAEAVRDGDFEVEPVHDDADDEIGVLARAFGQMVQHIERERRWLKMAIGHQRATEQALEQANADLEKRVVERTAALVQINRKLEQHLSERTRMELELRQAQKLESVGRLAAGVAHEINTPIQYVSDSCTFLQGAVADLDALVTGYRGVVDGVATGALDGDGARARAAAVEDAADVGYLLEQMPRATTRALDGLARVATIVRALKEFAHPERKEKAWADLNRAVSSVLEIARNEYKYVADVAVDLGELPPVLCHLGELNQAVLNIVVNAAHAIAAVFDGTERRGTITVTTRHEGDEAVIRVADTGTGIPADILDNIFDPFFTTKEVGKGTGQGLAIVRSVVVDKHGGKVDVVTQPGEGTTFTLRLPVGGEPAAAAA